MPNLSVEKIAGALAVLGTSVALAACGGDPPPAKAPVTSTETAAPGATGDKPADGHCGAGKEHKTGEASCSAGKPDPAAASASTPAATPAAATPAAATPAAPAASATPAATDPKKADPKKPAAPAAPAKKPTGAASCGAGTCAAKK